MHIKQQREDDSRKHLKLYMVRPLQKLPFTALGENTYFIEFVKAELALNNPGLKFKLLFYLISQFRNQNFY